MIDEHVWIRALDRISEIDGKLPASWPPELPPEGAPEFWTIAAQVEMRDRKRISELCSRLVEAGEAVSMTALDGWLCHRRVEWACQVILAKAHEGVVPPVPLSEVLIWALIGSWDSDGCIAFWYHAIERGGKPHPGNLDGLTPLPGM